MFSAFIADQRGSVSSHTTEESLIAAIGSLVDRANSRTLYATTLSSLHLYATTLGAVTSEQIDPVFRNELQRILNTDTDEYGLVLTTGALSVGLAQGEGSPMIWVDAPSANEREISRLSVSAGLTLERVSRHTYFSGLFGTNFPARAKAIWGTARLAFKHDVYPPDYIPGDGGPVGVSVQVDALAHALESRWAGLLIRSQRAWDGAASVEAYLPYEYAVEQASSSASLEDFLRDPYSARMSFIRMCVHPDFRSQFGLGNPDDLPSIVRETWTHLGKTSGGSPIYRRDVDFEGSDATTKFLVIRAEVAGVRRSS